VIISLNKYIRGGIGMRKVSIFYMVILLLFSFIPINVFADESESCTVSGYVKSEGNTNVKSGFKAEILGTNAYAVTDQEGCFYIYGASKSDDQKTIRISKPGFLTQEIDVDYLDSSSINFPSCPIEMWAGDIPKDGVNDGAINFSDVVQIAAGFNSVAGDLRYKEYCDLNMDKSVNISDIVLLAKHFNATSKDYAKPVIKLPVIYPAGKIEAEVMTLNDYIRDKYLDVDCIKVTGSIGSCGYKFGGDTGFYDINIRYLDEDNGQSEMGLYIGESRKEGYAWKLDFDDNMWKIKTMKNVLLKKGDRISVQGNKNGQESCRIDYIETVLQSVPTATPTPVTRTISGTVTKSNLEGIWYLIGYYSLSRFLPDMESLVGKDIEVTGYTTNDGDISIFPYTSFIVKSYKILSGITSTPAQTPTPKPTPTKAPEAVKLNGFLVWNDLEGGFWGFIDENGKKYSLGNMDLKEYYSGSMSLVEVTGYPHPDYSSIYMWGTPFELISIKKANSFGTTSTPVQTPTPKPTPEAVKLNGFLVWNDLEGGFWGFIDENGKKYSLGNMNLKEYYSGSMSLVEVTGYPHPDYASIYMWGTPFELISIKKTNIGGFNKIT
jgi:hypothetical protein